MSSEESDAPEVRESASSARSEESQEELIQELPAGIMDVLDPYSEDLEQRVSKERQLRQRTREILQQMAELQQEGTDHQPASKELRPGTVVHGGATLPRQRDQEQDRAHRTSQHRKRFAQLDRRGQGSFTLEDKLELPHPRMGSADEPSPQVVASWREARASLAPVIIEILDQDGDGKVTWEEFAAVPDYRQRAADILHFRSIDSDDDGRISPQEWHEFHAQRAKVRAAMAGEPAADEYDFSESFRRFDPEDKGFIDEETFVSILHERRQRSQQARASRPQAPPQAPHPPVQP
ncbi:MAG: hypothetical protein EA401_12660 [Planctomycetota bacterium]|nr:MAG: hypothetical protein EA401_12660 [Planctomycetota bacterium]